MTPTEIKRLLASPGNFFSRPTMRFFGDCMSSFACHEVDGKWYMYRKPDALVDCFGSFHPVTDNPTTFFGLWEVTQDRAGFYHLRGIHGETEKLAFWTDVLHQE